MLMVLNLPTFSGSPWHEVPTRPHNIWYDGPVAIILNIFLSSSLLSRETGFLHLLTMRFACLGSASVTCVKVLSLGGERVELNLHSKGKKSQLYQRHITHQDMHNFHRRIPHKCVSQNTQGKIACTTPNRIVRMSETTIITSVWESFYLMSSEATHAGKEILVTHTTHFRKYMY